MTAVERIEPGRGRAGDSLTIIGSGFAPGGANAVTIDGTAVPCVTLDSETLQVVAPAGVTVDQHVEVEVQNLDDGSSALWWWWSKATPAQLATYELAGKIPGPESVPDRYVVDHLDFARAAEKVRQPGDQLTTKGDLLAYLSSGLRRIAVGGDGQLPHVDPAAGLVWRFRNPTCIEFGYFSPIGSTGEVRFTPGAADDIATPVGLNGLVLKTGKLLLFQVYVRKADPFDFRRLNRFVLYRNEAPVLDTDDLTLGPSITTGQSWCVAPWLDVVQGDRIGIGAWRSGDTFDDIYARALVVVV